VQKNFPSEGAAQAFVNRHVQATERSLARPVVTFLSEKIVRSAEAAVGRLPVGCDLVEAVEFFIEHRRGVQGLRIEEAIEAFGAWLLGHRKNEGASVAQRVGRVRAFAKASGVARSDGISLGAAQAWIYAAGVGARSQRDRFDLLNQFCGFLVKKRLAQSNPVAELDRPVVRVEAPGVLSFGQAWGLLMAALTDAEGPEMLPFFSIAVLSGVRPQEIPRLSAGAVDEAGKPNPWADFHLDEAHRIIEVNKAKGGRSRRNVEICDPLGRILAWCRARKLAPNFFSKRKFDRVRRRAGLFDLWEKDILRHTYASHHYVLNKDVRGLVANMGNSELVLFQNYVRPVPRADAVALFGVILHWSAPRAASVMAMRMDRWLVKPVGDVDLDRLRILRTRLAGEVARSQRRGGDQAAGAVAAEKLAVILAELERRAQK
jgi:site-specific recombinase XerC